jgi:benzoate-CoA ligase family protein
MTAMYPEEFNIAEYFLDARIQEGRGERIALRTDAGDLTYGEVQELANRFGNVLRANGVQPEQRVIIALPDGPEYVAALFGVLKIGAVVVMVNPDLKPDAVEYFYRYTGAQVALIHANTAIAFQEAAASVETLERLMTVGDDEFSTALDQASADLENFPTHRDEAAIWLFSGGTTGQPKAVVQSHRSFANTTECYAKGHLGYSEDDITLSVPKLYFGYATGSNLLFPFSVGASAVLFPERCVTDVLFEKIRRFRPTILINVPTMVNHLLSHDDADAQDFSCLRFATSAGEALPVELHRRWNDMFGVDLLDGLGTAEMWHVFLSNRPGDVRPGTLGTVVEGFEVKVCDPDGNELPPGEVGLLRVRGGSRAIEYWEQPEKTREAFQCEWYLSSDMVSRSEDGVFTYAGRSDDMLKVSGKWLSPKEVENCLLQHSAVAECAVVGVVDGAGLTKPQAFVVRGEDAEGQPDRGLAAELQLHVKETLAPYKYPREIHFMDDLPRTHLGKVDRGKLRSAPSE